MVETQQSVNLCEDKKGTSWTGGWQKRRGPAWTGSPGESFLGKMQDALRNTHLPWHKFRPFVHNGITFWQSNLTCEAVREHYKAMTEQDQGISISHISYMLHSIYGKRRCTVHLLFPNHVFIVYRLSVAPPTSAYQQIGDAAAKHLGGWRERGGCWMFSSSWLFCIYSWQCKRGQCCVQTDVHHTLILSLINISNYSFAAIENVLSQITIIIITRP